MLGSPCALPPEALGWGQPGAGVPRWLGELLGSSPREEPKLWGWNQVQLPRAGVMKRANLVPLPGLTMIFMGKPLGFSRGCSAREHGCDCGSQGNFFVSFPAHGI